MVNPIMLKRGERGSFVAVSSDYLGWGLLQPDRHLWNDAWHSHNVTARLLSAAQSRLTRGYGERPELQH